MLPISSLALIPIALKTLAMVEHGESHSTGLGLLGGDASGAQAEEAAFERELKRKRKKRRKGLGL